MSTYREIADHTMRYEIVEVIEGRVHFKRLGEQDAPVQVVPEETFYRICEEESV